MSQSYIKIYSYKRIKVGDEFLDVFHLEDLEPAIEELGTYQILAGKYEGKLIRKLDSNFDEHDFCCKPITLVEKTLLTDGNLENTSAINIENYKLKSKYEYYIVLKDIDKKIYPSGFCLKETDDERIVKEFNRSLNPSVGDELLSLIGKSQDGSLALTPALINKMFGEDNNLPSVNQDKKDDSINIKDYKISEKLEQLKKKIIGLDDELKVLLSNINKNISLSHTNLPNDKIKELKTCTLILGPRGTGKTFMIESMADLFGVPSTIEDSTRYTPAGIKGADIEDILMNLYLNSGEKKEVFEHGIVFLDEIDKICRITGLEEYDLMKKTQEGLLTILRGTVIHKKVRNGFIEEPITLDTSKLTFVLAGAFEEIIDKENITKDDLIEYGMIPQLADRIHLFIKTKNPTKEELKRALVEGEFSYLKLFEEYLSLFNIPLKYDEDFIDYIVDEAYNSGKGYRALSTALTKHLNDILFDLYDGKLDVVKLSRKVGDGNNEKK